MKTVREVSYDLLRAYGMTTVFGNPGSNELPFLNQFAGDFRYILGLHEGVVLAMADGYAQATGRPALVSVHSAAGLGNAMGVLVNATISHTPLVIMAGQQNRAMMTLEAQLTNVDATLLPLPLLKWSVEPPRPQDVPAALARAISVAHTLTGIVAGGPAPLMFGTLYRAYGTTLSVSLYVCAALGVTVVVLSGTQEAAKTPLLET